MSDRMLNLRAPDISAHEEMLLLRGKNPMTFLYVGYRPGIGFSGALLIDTERRSLSECGKAIDQAVGSSAEIPFSSIRAGIPDGVLGAVIYPSFKGIGPGYQVDQMDALRELILSRFPAQGMNVLSRNTLRQSVSLIEWVNYLSCGDASARVQALRAVPLHTSQILTDPAFHALIDQRASLTPLIMQTAGMTTAEMRRYARIEAHFSTILTRSMDGQNPLSRELTVHPGRFESSILNSDTDRLRSLAIRAANCLRSDQIPRNPEDSAEMLTYISESERLRSALKLGMGPFQHHMRQVKATSDGQVPWGAACAHLQAQLPEQETQDYLKSLSSVMVTGLLIKHLRTQSGVDFESFGRAAHALREKGEPDKADVALLGAYVRTFNSEDYKLADMRSHMVRLIGEGHSLKSLREAQVRWHHVRQTFENEVMTNQDPLSWGALAGEVDLGDVRAIELTSSAALDRQGGEEKHCVATYTATVMGATSKGASLIFSIEEGDRILSTIEIIVKQSQWDKKQLDWKINQNKARGNAEAGPVALEAGERLLKILSNLPLKKVISYLTGMQHNTTQIRDSLALATTRAGGDIVNSDLPERIMATYEDVLPKNLRGIGSEGLLRELSRLVEADVSQQLEKITSVITKNLSEVRLEIDRSQESELQMAL